jgi:hypothetical protein
MEFEMNKLLLAAGLMCFAGISNAADMGKSKTGFGINVGTTGVGFEISIPLTRSINVRGGYNAAVFDIELEETDVTYDAEVDVTSGSLLVDWHPFQGKFRFTGGLHHFMTSEVQGSAVPGFGQTFIVNDIAYNASDLASLDLEVTSGNVDAPYFGIGWGNTASSDRLSITVDVGALNIGAPQIGMTANCITPGLCAAIDASVAAEMLELQSDLEDYEWWPVVSVGIRFTF